MRQQSTGPTGFIGVRQHSAWWRKGRATALTALAAFALVAPTLADAQQRTRAPRAEQGDLEDRPPPQATRPLPELVARVQATPPYDAMDYIGVAGFETRTMVYVLRFLDGRQVVVVRVDARTGRIIR
jgi:hypothetical protein